MVNKILKSFMAWFIVALISLASVTLYLLIKKSVEDILTSMGVSGFYIMSAVIIIGALFIIFLIKILFMRKISMTKTLKDILKL